MNKTKNDEFIKSFGENLRNLRKSKGYSQETLAFKANIPLSQIGRIERGEINTTINTVYIISEALDIDIRSFFSI